MFIRFWTSICQKGICCSADIQMYSEEPLATSKSFSSLRRRSYGSSPSSVVGLTTGVWLPFPASFYCWFYLKDCDVTFLLCAVMDFAYKVFKVALLFIFISLYAHISLGQVYPMLVWLSGATDRSLHETTRIPNGINLPYYQHKHTTGAIILGPCPEPRLRSQYSPNGEQYKFLIFMKVDKQQEWRS